jgi:hypothetical protein
VNTKINIKIVAGNGSFFKKLNINLPYNTAIPLLSI